MERRPMESICGAEEVEGTTRAVGEGGGGGSAEGIAVGERERGRKGEGGKKGEGGRGNKGVRKEEIQGKVFRPLGIWRGNSLFCFFPV